MRETEDFTCRFSYSETSLVGSIRDRNFSYLPSQKQTIKTILSYSHKTYSIRFLQNLSVWTSLKCFCLVKSENPFSNTSTLTHVTYRQYVSLCIKLLLQVLTHYHTMQLFDALKIYIAVENIVRKGEITWNRQFFLFITMFSTLYGPFHFKCNLKCHLQFVSICTTLKFSCLVMS